jgi:hypothetical protein
MSEPEYTIDVPMPETEAIQLQKAGFQIAGKLPPSIMARQLKEELIRIATEGDSSCEGAFTIAVAARVEKFVIAAREILMTEKLATNDIGALLAMRKKRHLGMMNGMYGMSDDYGEGVLMGSPLGIPNENFGVQAIKQVVEAMRSMQDSPTKPVEALASARQLGMNDVATELEKKLGVIKQAVPATIVEEGNAP